MTGVSLPNEWRDSVMDKLNMAPGNARTRSRSSDLSASGQKTIEIATARARDGASLPGIHPKWELLEPYRAA